MSFRYRYLLHCGVSFAGIALAASHAMAQGSAPAAGEPKPAVTQLPTIEVTTTQKAAKKKKQKSAAKAQSSPVPVAPPPEPTAAELAAEEKAALEQAWKTTGNPTPTKALGNLPPDYAGGMVATGGGLGMLGNKSFMDTPFSQTSYTAKTIQDQQARSVGDVVANDPSVRTNSSASGGYGQESYNIRGFFYDNADIGLNGLYGLAPYYTVAPNFVERVEVLKGPNALLNGMPPGGAVGGSINLVTKQAPDEPITQLTTSYVSDGYFGTDLDVARRFGLNKEFGVRFNGGYHAGDTAIENQDQELGNAVLNLDYRGERLRMSADLGYQKQNLDGLTRFITIMPTAGFVPPPPEPGSNYGVPWAYYKPTDRFAMIQGEFDITENVTAYASYGWHDSDNDFRFSSVNVTNAGGDGNYLSAAAQGNNSFETWAGVAGVRSEFDTGPVSHLVNVSYSSVQRDSTNPTASGGLFASNLYNPVNQPVPVFGPVIFSQFGETELSSVGISDTLSILDDRVQVTVGARRQTAGTSTKNLLAPTPPDSTEESVWSPAYAVLVKPFNNVSLYANYIEGLKMGRTVPENGTFANPGTVFPPYKTKQKEVGVKFDFGRFSTTLAAFDIQQPVFVNTFSPPELRPFLALGGEQRNKGVEFSVFGELMPGFRLLGGVAYIDGRLTKTGDFDGDQELGDYDGNKAQGVAEWNVNATAEWDTPFVPGLTLIGQMIHTSDAYVNAANTLSMPAWTRFDVGARYTFDSPWNGKPVTIRFEVENVANESYYAGSYTSDGIVTVGAPRTYMLSSTFNF